MAVVINDFEVVSDAPAARRGEHEKPADADAAKDGDKPEAHEVRKAVRELHAHALRVWAH